MATREGYYTSDDKLVQEGGLICAGVISPPSNIPSSVSDIFDVIVIGAGYAGLTSCRDLCMSGYKVLLLEARDRVGGRTWTAEIDNHLYEMGGTWVHWGQPHVYREMSRYGMTKFLDSDADKVGCNYFTSWVNGKAKNISYEEEFSAASRAFEEFFNVDGEYGKLILPYPHDPHFNPDAQQWDKISAAQRIRDIQSTLNTLELNTLQAFVAAISGNNTESTGFFDVLRWWALSGYTTHSLFDFTERYKIPQGQSRFARCFFDEALNTRNLRYSFNTLVTSIRNNSETMEVSTPNGTTWLGRKIICTVPLNVLPQIEFNPTLNFEKKTAISHPHIGLGAKVHMEVQGTNLRTWSAGAWPDHRVFSCRGDGITPAGNTHLVFFAKNKQIDIQKDAQDMVEEAKSLHPMDVKKVVWHNWLQDPLSRGIWCMFAPDRSFKYLDLLRERHGNIFFASGDWALGWRGFIDGAIEEGTRASVAVMAELGFPGRIVPSL